MGLPSGECLKFVQDVLLYELDVRYLNSRYNEVSDPSYEKITSIYTYQKRRYRNFWLLVGKIKHSIQSVWMLSF